MRPVTVILDLAYTYFRLNLLNCFWNWKKLFKGMDVGEHCLGFAEMAEVQNQWKST